MKPRLAITFCVFIALGALALLSGRRAAAQEPAPAAGGALVSPPAYAVFLPVVMRPAAAPPPASSRFFIEPMPALDRPTSRPTVKVDAAGGVHVVFAPESVTPQHPTRSVLYAYCAANCSSAAAFTVVPLGYDVEYAHLAVTPAGQPRVLARRRPPSGDGFVYQYWQCEALCTQAAQWSATSIGAAFARATGWGEPFSQSFALDHLGRPRFVYYDAGADQDDPHWGAFYAFCDVDCASAANWQETRLLDDPHAREFALAFGPTGQPRLAYLSYDPDAVAQYVAYAECNAACASAANWSGLRLVNTASAGVTEFAALALRTDSGGRPRLALYTGTGSGGTLDPNTLYYLSCAAAPCTQGQTWRALDLGLPATQGEAGVDLALDGQDRPRLAYHAPLAAGFGLRYAWCNASCETSVSGWQSMEVEPAGQVDQELPILPWPACPFPQCNPPRPACTLSFWDTGVRPSLALDGAGHPRLAYDAEHHQGGACGTYTDAKLTRFAVFAQP